MVRKLVIITEIIAPYRIPVFNALAQRSDVDLHVIFLADTDPSLRQWPVYKSEIRFSYEVLHSLRLRIDKHGLLINRGLAAALKAAGPESIICGGYNYPASWVALWWARQHKIRFVLWTESNQHDERSGHLVVEGLKKYFVKSCDAFVVPGTFSSIYLQNLGASKQHIFTAPNAVDNVFFADQAAKTRSSAAAFRERFGLPQRFFLFVGRLVPEKGIFDLLEAYAKLDDKLRSEVGLVFAGDGMAIDRLKSAAETIQPGIVCFPGFAHREDLAAFYALADALVLPTHSDPWGLVVNEAMACATPVIVTNVAGCAEDLVQDGWNGYIVPPRNAESLCNTMGLLLKHPDRRTEMGIRSRQRIADNSPEKCAEGLAAAALQLPLETQ